MRHFAFVLCIAVTLIAVSGCGSSPNVVRPPSVLQPPSTPPSSDPEGQPSKPPERHTVVIVGEYSSDTSAVAIATYDFNVDSGTMRFLDRRATDSISGLMTVPGTRRIIVPTGSAPPFITAEVDESGKISEFVPLSSIPFEDFGSGAPIGGIVHPSGKYFYLIGPSNVLYALDLTGTPPFPKIDSLPIADPLDYGGGTEALVGFTNAGSTLVMSLSVACWMCQTSYDVVSLLDSGKFGAKRYNWGPFKDPSIPLILSARDNRMLVRWTHYDNENTYTFDGLELFKPEPDGTFTSLASCTSSENACEPLLPGNAMTQDGKLAMGYRENGSLDVIFTVPLIPGAPLRTLSNPIAHSVYAQYAIDEANNLVFQPLYQTGMMHIYRIEPSGTLQEIAPQPLENAPVEVAILGQ